MSLVTRCPTCSTMFKVVPDQLRIAAGWVRCGHCGEVFDSAAHMLSYEESQQAEAALSAPAPPPPELPAPSPKLSAPLASSVSPARPASVVPQASYGPVVSTAGMLTKPSDAASVPAKERGDAPAALPEPVEESPAPPAATSELAAAAPSPAVLLLDPSAIAPRAESELFKPPSPAAVESSAESQAEEALVDASIDVSTNALVQWPPQALGPEPLPEVERPTQPAAWTSLPTHPAFMEPVWATEPAELAAPVATLEAAEDAAPAHAGFFAPSEIAASYVLDSNILVPEMAEPDAVTFTPPAEVSVNASEEPPAKPSAEAGATDVQARFKEAPLLQDDRVHTTAQATERAVDDSPAPDALSPVALPDKPSPTVAAPIEEPAPALVAAPALEPVLASASAAKQPGNASSASVAELKNPKPKLKPEASSASDRRRKPEAAKKSVPASAPESSPESTGGSEAQGGELSFVKQAQRRAFWSSRPVRVGLWTAAAVLLLALLLQVAVARRDWLAARHPGLLPLLQTVCQPLGCAVRPYRQLNAMVIDGSGFTRLSDNQFSFSVTLRNTADLPVAMPDLELTLTDAQDQALVRRVVTAADLSAPPSLAARGEFSGASTLTVDGAARPDAVMGYRLTVFYP
ncbi:DUF3426 domain-containing protein [Ottowia sp.]|uniref:DUF3426 domain-containing protein n=1 Tax=Ottowia sp. TaxID=1898956 RepID=UPI003A8C5E85